jgi:hypothetical protein
LLSIHTFKKWRAQVIAILSGLLLVFLAADGAAQTRAARWDIAAGTGVFAGHPGNPGDGESFENWYHSATLGLTLGRYFTPNLKLEGEATISGEGSRYGLRTIQVPTLGPFPISVERQTRTNSASGALVWQFFENQWVHPFLMAGATVDFDRESLHTWPQSSFRGDPRVPGSEVLLTTERVEHLGTTRRIRALVGGGAKLYVAPGAFFRADSRIGIGGDDAGHVAVRLGFGVDF